MGRKEENTGFVCRHCGREVLPLTGGSYRNHCPFCLYSLHVDIIPGDRASECGGLMEPVGIIHNSGKGWQIVHRCQKCGFERCNMVSEDPRQPDDINAITALILRAAADFFMRKIFYRHHGRLYY